MSMRDGKPVVGYGFNSNGRYGQGGLIRERFAPRLMEADPKTLLDEAGDNLDPDKVWATLMSNEKPGGHGERSVAVGTIDMAVWDAVAKIARQAAVPPARRASRAHGQSARVRLRRRRLLLSRQGPVDAARRDARLSRSRLQRRQDEDRRRADRGRPQAHRGRARGDRQRGAARRRRQRPLRSGDRASPTPRCCATIRCSGTRRPAIRSTSSCRPRWRNSIPGRWRPARTCSATRTRAT